MISIIVIGHNEGWRLTKCLKSISSIIQIYAHLEFEVIYVDSKSNDDSVKRVKSFNEINHIFVITGEANAAIARNIGAKEALGDILFFVDGDMELDFNFLDHALDKKGKLKFDVLTGHLDDYFYSYEGNYLDKAPRTYSRNIPKKIEELVTFGGIFLLNKEIWSQLNGMSTKFKVNEDLDLSLRLNNLGIKAKRLPHLITKHHTIDYRNEKRMWANLREGNNLYPGLLFRDHVFNLDVLKRTLRVNYTAAMLPFLFISLFFSFQLFSIVIAFYLLILILRVFKQMMDAKTLKSKFLYFFERLLYQIVIDLVFWGGFLFFYPKKHSLEYNSVHNHS